MGGKGRGCEGPLTPGMAAKQAMSLREETSGRTCVDEASLLRVKHLQRLAAWAGAEAGVGPIGALLGRRLAASAEATGVPLGAATFLCQRCETILKPGFNCTVRIRNKKNKTKRRKKSNCCQNRVSYACHFCGVQNLILGSGKGVVKNLLSSREQDSVGLTHRSLKGNKGNTTTQYMKDLSEHPQALLVDPPSRLTQLTSERAEQGESLKLNLPTDREIEEGATLSSVESGRLALSNFEERSMQKIVLENANPSRDSSKKIETCEANVTLDAAMVGSEFATPQKIKSVGSVEPFTTKSTGNRKGEASQSVVGKSLSNSGKSVRNDSCKHSKSATNDGVQVPGSSRKRARKRWTTLKEIAEKDEIERKEKMGNFVIPFFLQ